MKYSLKFGLARYLLWFYSAFIIYASLYPFSDWKSNGISIFDFWFDPQSRYLSRLDIWLNICGYLPLGALFVWRWYPKISGIVAIFIATICIGILSFSMESLQTFLPLRVPSQLDWYTNTIGGFMGAVIASIFSPTILYKFNLIKWYKHNFYNNSFAMAVCILWCMAIIFPQPYWFGLGSWVTQIEDTSFMSYILQYYQSIWIYIYNIIPFTSFQELHQILIPFVIIFSLCGMLLAISLNIQSKRILFSLVILFILCLIKIIALSFYLSILYLEIPLNVWVGLAGSIFILIITYKANSMLRALLAFIFITISIILVNILPHNLYHFEILYTWQNSPYSHLIGLFKWIGLLLPWFTLILIVINVLNFDNKQNIKN